MTVKELTEQCPFEIVHLGNPDAVLTEPYCCDLLSIAMGNAPRQVKEAADYVTASNDEEGVFIALKGLRLKAPDAARNPEKAR